MTVETLFWFSLGILIGYAIMGFIDYWFHHR